MALCVMEFPMLLLFPLDESFHVVLLLIHHILYLKYRSLDAVENRITAGGETYDITGISDMGSDKRYLAVHLEIKK